MVICLERGAELYMAQLMQLALTVSCFSKIHIGFGFTFLVPAHLSSPGQRAVKRVCVCVFKGGYGVGRRGKSHVDTQTANWRRGVVVSGGRHERS